MQKKHEKNWNKMFSLNSSKIIIFFFFFLSSHLVLSPCYFFFLFNQPAHLLNVRILWKFNPKIQIKLKIQSKFHWKFILKKNFHLKKNDATVEIFGLWYERQLRTKSKYLTSQWVELYQNWTYLMWRKKTWFAGTGHSHWPLA